MADHIKLTDVVTAESQLHLIGCPQCQFAFPAAYFLAKADPSYWRLVDHWSDLTARGDGPDCA
jgi:hypothetical protein